MMSQSQVSVLNEYVSQDAFLRKLADEFTTDDQRIFVDHFSAYMAYDPSSFVVDLDDVVTWLGFSRKDAALRVVRAKLEEGTDFKSFSAAPQPGGGGVGGSGRNRECHMLTIEAFKMLCMLAGTPQGARIRRYFVKMEGVLMRHVADLLANGARAPATPDEASLLEASRNAQRRIIAGGVESYASAERLGVHMVVNDLVRGGRITQVAARDSARLTRAGATIAKRFRENENSCEISPTSDGAGYELVWSGKAPTRIPSITAEIASLCRMRHSTAYGLREVHCRTVYDPWTYPGAFKSVMEQVVCAAFEIPVLMRAAPNRTSPWG